MNVENQMQGEPRKTDDRTAVELLSSADVIGKVLTFIAVVYILGGVIAIVFGLSGKSPILLGVGAASITFGILLGSIKGYFTSFSKMFCRLVLTVEGKLPKQG